MITASLAALILWLGANVPVSPIDNKVGFVFYTSAVYRQTILEFSLPRPFPEGVGIFNPAPNDKSCLPGLYFVDVHEHIPDWIHKGRIDFLSRPEIRFFMGLVSLFNDSSIISNNQDIKVNNNFVGWRLPVIPENHVDLRIELPVVKTNLDSMIVNVGAQLPFSGIVGQIDRSFCGAGGNPRCLIGPDQEPYLNCAYYRQNGGENSDSLGPVGDSFIIRFGPYYLIGALIGAVWVVLMLWFNRGSPNLPPIESDKERKERGRDGA
jgi:hypothetical protein